MQPKGFIGILPLFAIIAVLVATVGGGAYYLTHKTPAAQSPFYEPVSNTQTTVFAAPAQTPSAGSAISVPGMSKYTDADFGFSFWYPSGWTLVDTPVLSHNFEGGKVIKHLEFTDASTPYARRISIDEFYTSSSSITDYWRVGFIKHYFDDSRQHWMIHDHSDV